VLEVAGNRDCNSTARGLERHFHLSFCPKFRERFRFSQVLFDFPIARILSVDFLIRTDTRPGNVLDKVESRARLEADLRGKHDATVSGKFPAFSLIHCLANGY